MAERFIDAKGWTTQLLGGMKPGPLRSLLTFGIGGPLLAAESAEQAIRAPRRFMQGEIDPYSDEGIAEVLNMAGMAGAGTMFAAPKGALGAGPVMPRRHTLPMDEASRAARAKDLGFNRDAYHATSGDFDEFELGHGGRGSEEAIGFHFASSPDQANSRTSMSAGGPDNFNSMSPDELQQLIEWGVEGANTMPVKLKANNPLRLNDSVGDEGFWEVDHLVKQLKRHSDFKDEPLIKEAQKQLREGGGDKELTDRLIKLIETKGYDSIVYKNKVERGTKGKLEDSYIVFRPNQIRSKFAEFDPNKRDSANILNMGGVPVPLSDEELADALLKGNVI